MKSLQSDPTQWTQASPSVGRLSGFWQGGIHSAEEAASALKLTPKDMKKNKLIDGIIKEPIGGAHSNHEATFKKVKTEIKKHIKVLSAMDPNDLINERIEKFTSMGVVSN